MLWATPVIETFIVLNNYSIFTMKQLLVIILWIVPSTLFSQMKAFEAKGDSPSLYFNHQLGSEESFLSLALHYRLSPNVIAQYNALPLGTQLIKGQTIKIPVTGSNLNATGMSKNVTEILVPLVVTVKTKASIINVCSDYNISDTLLKKWNPQLEYDIPAATTLVIGFIRTRQNTTASMPAKSKVLETTPNNSERKNEVIAPSKVSSTQKIESTTSPKTVAETDKKILPVKVEATQPNPASVKKIGGIANYPMVSAENVKITETDKKIPLKTIESFKETETKSVNVQSATIVSDSISRLNSDDLFQLARKKAFDNKDYITALSICNIALIKSPEYNDIKIFKGRLYNWMGQVDSARDNFEQVLVKDPEDLEAYLAYIDLENWNDHYEQALSLTQKGLVYHPTSTQLLLKKAKILLNLNKPIEANQVINQLLKIEPTNTAARALGEKFRNETSKNAIGFTYDYFYFDKQFSDPWHLGSIDYRRQTKIGSLGAHLNYANRFNRSGMQYEIDGYPRIMNHVNAYFSFAYSNDVGIFAKYRGGTSLYIALPKSFDAEIGFRYLFFSDATWIYTLAAGRYYKNWYFVARTYLTPSNQNISQSYNLTARYYFGGANDFIALGVGTGISPDETTTDILLNSTYKLISQKVSANYRHAFKNNYVVSLTAGWVNQEYRPKMKGNQIDAGMSLLYRF